ncbi:MAG: cyclic nucleotide-binding domain-containing protein [Desulfarculaceae bacterium]|nr:cyclic nucleotide-binding domain-containing protein [Desulfarculaceae bacterium]
MIEQFTSDPKLSRYVVSFHQGQTLFLEGEDSQNLYILLEGKLDVLKGQQVISAIQEPGAVFGEMSFLLGSRRTATVKATQEGRAVSIPREEINDFLEQFPDLARQMTRLLAHRLDDASQVLFGLKEFSDMLPDAVVLTDVNCKIVAFNQAATGLFGRQWRQVGQRPLEGLFEKGEEVRALARAAASGQNTQEKTVAIEHPVNGKRYVALSVSGLYDARQEFKGLLVVGRDETNTHRLKRRFTHLRRWLIAASLGLLICAAALVFYPQLSSQMTGGGENLEKVRTQLISDRMLLTSLLAEPVAEGRIERSHEVLTRFFKMPQAKSLPYTGLVILGPDKRVLEAYSPFNDMVTQGVGTSFGHITFLRTGQGDHAVLNYFQQDRSQGGSRPVTALAYRLENNGKPIGWLLVKLDPERLKKSYGVARDQLATMDLAAPQP